MRIVYILTSLGIGGAEKQVIALAERMAARGNSVVLLVLKSVQGNEWRTGLRVHHLGMRKSPLGIMTALIRARRVLGDFKPDILHSHTFPANMTARLLRLLGVASATLSTIHNVYEGGPLRMLLYRLTDPLARHTTAVSTAAAERYIAQNAVPGSKCSVIHNAIDLSEFTPKQKRPKYSQSQTQDSESFVWIAIGRIAPAKDYTNLLHAFAKVRLQEPRAHLWIAGEPVDEDEAKLLCDLTQRLELASRVEFLGLRRDIAPLLDSVDGFVLSSAWEGMPLVAGEAMAMEKPVVATDVGGVREIVGECGHIVPAGNAEALAEALLQTMRATAEERHALGRYARQRITSQFSIDARVAQWEALYANVLSGTFRAGQGHTLHR